MSLESLQKRVGDVYQVAEGSQENGFETAVDTVMTDEVDHLNLKLVYGKNDEAVVYNIDEVARRHNIEDISAQSSSVVNVKFTYTNTEKKEPVSLGTATFILLSIDEVKQGVKADLEALKISKNLDEISIPVHKYIDIQIPNTALKKLLTSSVTTKGTVTEAAAEEALRVKLATLNIEALKAKVAKTVEEQLQLMISEAFDELMVLKEQHLRWGNYPVGQEATEIFEAMTGLLENPKSVPHYQTILKCASQVNGRREWSLVMLGVLLVLGGGAISTEMIVWMCLGHIGSINAIGLMGLAMLAGGIVALCGSKPRAQSAELYKVGDAASACQPGWFSSVFSNPPHNFLNTPSLHNTTPASLPLLVQKS